MVIEPYQRVFHWVRLTYADRPTCRLTATAVEQACGVEARVCARVLDDLVRARLLVRLPGAAYGLRPLSDRGDTAPPRLRQVFSH